tara:strand:+ start:4212 stop:4457 length:246 start_codon:yes stop_codon:yes gene_type:complete
MSKPTIEEMRDQLKAYIDGSGDCRWYFEKDMVELIYQGDMECFVYLNFKNMTFDTADSHKLNWLLEELSKEGMEHFIKEND